MRIISGEFRGRKLENFEGMDIRPTSDRVKESLFNIINEKVIDCEFLDLFAGTGNIGIEAYSRGAKRVVLVDSSPKSIMVVNANLKLLKIEDELEVYNTDYAAIITRLGKDKRQFDIIFIDPPYRKGIEEEILNMILKNNVLKTKGHIIIEHDAKDIMPDKVENIIKTREKQYGNTKLSFYTLTLLMV